MPGNASILITCEHGGNTVPPAWRQLFAGRHALLASHRGWDPGALELARSLARHFDAPLVWSRVTRLLVDLNRSRGHRNLFSEVTRPLPRAVRERILARHYLPYRRAVVDQVAAAVTAGKRLVHVSAHSFTPVLNGERRNADIGLLYDPRRTGEQRLALRWQAALHHLRPELRVRRNYPYTGRADGLTTKLRRQFPASRYTTVELEVNQRLVTGNRRDWARLRRMLATSLELALR